MEKDTIKSFDTLVLSGGSIKGLITLGALQYCYDNNMLQNVKTYIGTSSGSMCCYLLAIGYTPIEIMVYICTNQILEKISNLNLVGLLQGNGACSFTPVHEHLEKMTIQKIGFLPTLNDIKEKFDKTLVFATHNLTQNMTEYLSWENYPHIPCLTAIRMSANLPFIFEMFRYGHSLYIDGGISDNLPIEISENYGEKICAIYLNNHVRQIDLSTEIGLLNYLYTLLFISMNKILELKKKIVSDKVTFIEIEDNTKVSAVDFNLNTSTRMDMFSHGYTSVVTK